MSKLKVEWTGEYPCLCIGEWIISYNGKTLNIPKDIKHDTMNTFNVCSAWEFNDEYDI